jgi:cytidylate kinase
VRDSTARLLLITIDGPAGSGKTTVSRRLAERLGYRYVDTGALYRAVAVAALDGDVAADDDKGLERLCGRLEIAYDPATGRLLLDGRNVGPRLRSPQVSLLASAISARPVVRRFLLGLQRRLGRAKGAVFEGRDMGTVVFPDADIKFYLDAAPETRSLRRYRELDSEAGQTLSQVRRDMQRRDRADSSRELAPLKPAPDAVAVDSTQISVEKVVETMMGHIRRCTAGD